MALIVVRPLRALVALAFVITLAAACDKKGPLPVPDEPAVVGRAQSSLAPYKGALKDALQKAMAESPEAAIDVCAKRAPELAAEHSKNGATLGRSAIKLRNPSNAARPWLEPAMARLAKAPSGSDAHEVVALEGGRSAYAEAIWVGPQCLACHGDPIAPNLASKLDAKYPKDAARGFKQGDFRGVFWVELDK